MQKIGKPILRCGKCHSLNFRVLDRTQVEEDSPADYLPLLRAVEENVLESEEECENISSGSLSPDS